jgi:hypothetical protein
MERTYLQRWKAFLTEDATQSIDFEEGKMYEVYDHAWGDWVPAMFIGYNSADEDYVLLNPTKFPWNDRFKEFKKFIATTICQIVRIERVQSHSGENFLGYKENFMLIILSLFSSF